MEEQEGKVVLKQCEVDGNKINVVNEYVEGDKIAGSISYKMDALNPQKMSVGRMLIQEDADAAKVGKSLIQRMISNAENAGIKQVWAEECDLKNIEMLRIYGGLSIFEQTDDAWGQVLYRQVTERDVSADTNFEKRNADKKVVTAYRNKVDILKAEINTLRQDVKKSEKAISSKTKSGLIL